MGKIYKCNNCHYSTFNELEFQRHLTDAEFSCKPVIVDSDNYIKNKKHYINRLIGEYRELFKKFDEFRFCEVSKIDMDHVKEIYSFLSITLNRIHEKIIDLKDNVSQKHLDRLSKSRDNLTDAYWHISNRFMEEELKEIHKLDEKIREYHELRRIQKLEGIKRQKRHEFLKLTVQNVNKFQNSECDADPVEIDSSLVSSRTAFVLELRERLRQYKQDRINGKQTFQPHKCGFDNTPIDTRFHMI